MKLIHCADIHLDAPLGSVFPPEEAAKYRRAVLANFASLVRLADAGGADALLIAGDLFDSDVYEALELKHCVHERKVYGGPSKDDVTRQIQYIKDFVADHR